MTRLRVAFVGLRALAGRWGGVEAHVEAVATRLAARGHDVAAFVRPGYAGAAPGVRRLVRPTLPGKHAEAAVHSLLCSLEATAPRYDVVHVHALGPALFCGLPRLAGRRVVTTIHGLDHERAKWGRVARAALRAGERCALRFSHAVLVVSRHLAAHYAARGHPVVHLPNGVDAARPVPPARIRERFGLAGGDYVLFLGRWTPSKRVRELVEAFRDAAPPGLRLVVAGRGPPRYAEAVRAAANGATVFPGLVDGALKQELLANARACVSFAAVEGLPVAMLEAMAHGRVCVGSDIGAHRELLGDGRGLVCPAATHEERVAALRAPLDPALGEAARAFVRREHDWDRIVDRLEGIYGELCAS